MMSIIRRLVSKIFPAAGVFLDNVFTLAFKYGQWMSIKSSMAVDAQGNPIPWYTYSAIEYLNSFDFTAFNVFEFGSGNSSLYWSSRAKSVVSVEDNLDWFNIVKIKSKVNHALIYRADESDYVNALAEQGRKFDIIVIDGNHRLKCTTEAINMIDPDGIILLDNSDRLIEKECGNLLRVNGFIQMDFSGFGPINGYCWTTSIFLKNNKIFLKKYSGPSPINGLAN
jgi:hypothetical protein